MNIIPKSIARKPVTRIETYTRYGLYDARSTFHYCPRCLHVLNAGPDYQPRYCDRCGQRVNFDGIEWKEAEFVGYVGEEERKLQRIRENELAGIKEDE